MKTEYDYIERIGGTWENDNNNPGASNKYNQYDKESRENLMGFLLPPGEKILDIGCSIGVWAEFLEQKGFWERWGVDISEERLKEARKRGYQTLQTNGTCLPEALPSFDAVICIDVLVHTLQDKDRQQLMNEAYRTLKPNGVFIFSVQPKTSVSYCKPLSIAHAQEMALNAGFTVEKTVGIQYFPLTWKEGFGIAYFWDWLLGLNAPELANVVFIKAIKTRKS